MKRLFAIIGTVPLVLLAACGDDDDNSSATVPSATTQVPSATGSTATGSTTAGGTSAATVKVVAVPDLGNVLANSDGMVLYVNDQDTATTVKCVDTCTDEWPPLTTTGTPMGDGVSSLATVDRPDGTKQVTYDGHPLYTFKDDTAPMKATGDGANDNFGGQDFSWHVASVDTAAGGATATTMAAGSQSTPSTTGY